MHSFKNTCLILGLLVTLFISCKDKSVSVEVEQQPVPEAGVSSSGEAPQETGTTVTLNNGVKWEVDDQVSSAIMLMQKTIKELPSSEEARNYPALKEDLESQFTVAVSGTSLTGDALTQYENYMSTIKLLFEDLVSPDAATRQEAVQKLSKHLDTFNNYFS